MSAFLRQYTDWVVFDMNSSGFYVKDFSFALNSLLKCKITSNILINMKNISYVDDDFLEYFFTLSKNLKNVKISFYNVNPVINALIYIVKLDKKFEIYISEEEALKGFHPLVKRRMTLFLKKN